jgi:hypothetical protein
MLLYPILLFVCVIPVDSSDERDHSEDYPSKKRRTTSGEQSCSSTKSSDILSQSFQDMSICESEKSASLPRDIADYVTSNYETVEKPVLLDLLTNRYKMAGYKNGYVDTKMAAKMFLEKHGKSGTKVFSPYHELRIFEKEHFHPPSLATHRQAMAAENQLGSPHECILPRNDLLENEADNDWQFSTMLPEDYYDDE